jgi:hypothetical protein
MALNEVKTTFHEYTMLFYDFERRSKVDMNDDGLCNCFINGMANVTLRTHAMSNRVKLVTPLTIVEFQYFLNHFVVNPSHMGRVDRS